jgi:hypothetical protein
MPAGAQGRRFYNLSTAKMLSLVIFSLSNTRIMLRMTKLNASSELRLVDGK